MNYQVYSKRKSDLTDYLVHSTGKSIIMDDAAAFYAQLEEACTPSADTAARYAMLRSVYRRVVDQSVLNCQIAFVGFFSKLDYCIKEFGIPFRIANLLHMSRKDLFPEHNRKSTLADEDMERLFPHNLKATALLVHWLCGRQEIPESLQKHFPTADRKHTWGKFDERAVRVVVERWDDNYIWATEEENNSTWQICYGTDNKILTRDGKSSWSYLKQILWVGAQLNLVRVRRDERGEIYLPELIIVEPDYLINVTTIAGCFETYAESPFVNLVKKLAPPPNSLSIHLGNLAGQLLDETVHGQDIPFEETFRRYTHEHVLGLIACQNLTEKFLQFRDDAKVQKRNIEKLVGADLPQAIGNYDSREVVLEPSFFSEVLGIQGRLDFLYEKDGDCVIIEQKSGKGGFAPVYDPDVPVAQEPHLVQMLLYRALFQYEFNKYSDQLKHILLLYSKYAKGLLRAPQNGDLLQRAFRIRNLMAWAEIMYAKEGMDIIKTLTPEKLNMKRINGKLWEVYVRPQLAELLAPVATASPLELAYYLRFMRFIANEQLLSKMGNKLKEDSGFAAIWHDTLDDKKSAGKIYDELSIRSYGPDHGPVSSVTLDFGNREAAGTANFRPGDIVVLYPYRRGEIPNACTQTVIRASIEDIREQGVVLRLRNSQTDRRTFGRYHDCLWAIEHDMYESSTNALYAAMHSFLSTTRRRRDLLMAQRQPEVDTSCEIKGEYGAFDTLTRRAKQARELFLIIGPPGTGKTSYGLVNLLKEELLEEGTNVLLLSYTNRAVDEICSKLVEIKEKDAAFDFLRIGSDLSCAKEYRPYLLGNRTKGCGGNEAMKIIKSTRVFCGTTAALNSNMALFSLKHFSLAIVDEASQILEPHLIGLFSVLSHGKEAIDRFVLVGDHKQLPAVVQQMPDESAVEEKILRDIHLTDCRHSLFERLLSLFRKDGAYDERYVYMLTRQGRMHRDIADFPNQAFYGGKLDIVPLEHQTLPNLTARTGNDIDELLTSHRITFVASENPHSGTAVKTNDVEARIIAATVHRIYLLAGKSFDTEKTIGVIVPYRNQIATVRNAIDQYGVAALHDIAIDTVERYQGSQRDYIIYGFTIQRTYQLNFLTNNVFEEDGMVIDRKLNVAMTRARLCLVMVGNPILLSENYTFSRLMHYVRQKGGYLAVPCEDYCEGRFRMQQER